MLGLYAEKFDKYLSYAYAICRCDSEKNDLVGEMFLRLHKILKDDPSKEISDGYIYLMMKSIFIDSKRCQREYPCDMEDFNRMEEMGSTSLDERHEMNELITRLPFFDREILMRCQETSRRKLAKELGVHVQTVINYENRAKEKLKSLMTEI